MQITPKMVNLHKYFMASTQIFYGYVPL